MNKYKLSIIIPIFNGINYLEQCLDSVLNQLPDDYQCIVVDDGSNEETRNKLKEYEGRHANLRIEYCEHGGASVARNQGISLAEGEYIAFMDGDDCSCEGFFDKSRVLLESNADLYIFSIEYITFKNGERVVEHWRVNDKVYESASEFADEYIRRGHLLVYSQCNKFYKRSIIEEHNLKFDNQHCFGEDRLFNYRYISYCGRIETSSLYMFQYLMRNPESLSSKHIPNYFDTAYELHRAKVDYFTELSKGTNEKERTEFIRSDLAKEVRRAILRFDEHPEEIEEGISSINKHIFEEAAAEDIVPDIILILGSTNCEYKVKHALEVGKSNPNAVYVVSGGNQYSDTIRTEAEAMADYLESHGIDSDRIFLENHAKYTKENIELAVPIMAEACRKFEIRRPVIGIVSGGFHMRRIKQLVEKYTPEIASLVVFYPAYGAHTRPDNWYADEYGQKVIFSEMLKRD